MNKNSRLPTRSGQWIGAVVLAFVVATAPRSAQATTMEKLSVDRMSAEATLIVQGYVAWDYSSQQGTWTPIYTYTGIEVTRCVAGECPETLTLKHRGGTVGDLTHFIPGVPKFSVGQEVLLFLRPDPEGEHDRWAVFGWVQGTFAVLEDPETHEKVAVQQLEGVSLVSPGPDGVLVDDDSVKPAVIELESLVAWIRSARAAAAKAGGK